MKQKRLLTWILAVVLLIASLALVACVDKPQAKQLTELALPQLGDNQMAVIIKNGDKDYTSYTVTLTDDMQTGEDVLNYLADKADLQIDWQDSEYGKFINGIGGAKVHAGTSEFVNVMTSVQKDKGTWAGVKTYNVGDVTLAASAVGVSEMSVEAGAVIYFEIDTY